MILFVLAVVGLCFMASSKNEATRQVAGIILGGGLILAVLVAFIALL